MRFTKARRLREEIGAPVGVQGCLGLIVSGLRLVSQWLGWSAGLGDRPRTCQTWLLVWKQRGHEPLNQKQELLGALLVAALFSC